MATRRDILKALASIPVAATATLDVHSRIKDDDLVVIQCDKHLTQEQALTMRTEIAKLHMGAREQQVVVLGSGMSLSVHRGIARIEVV